MGMETTPTYSFGDLITQRRVRVRPELAGTGEPAFEWVQHRGIVFWVSTRRDRLGDDACIEVNPVDYLVRAFFPVEGKFRTVRASKIEHI